MRGKKKPTIKAVRAKAGREGAKVRNKSLTAEQRKQAARKAARARWKKKKPK